MCLWQVLAVSEIEHENVFGCGDTRTSGSVINGPADKVVSDCMLVADNPMTETYSIDDRKEAANVLWPD